MTLSGKIGSPGTNHKSLESAVFQIPRLVV